VIDVARFADGQMIEHWGVPDRMSILQQLGHHA
jgi:predicted ester cyclase